MSKDSQDDSVIEFTPEPGFMIEKLASNIVQMMRDMEMDARINLADGVVIEIDKECTVKEIVEGYKEFIKQHISSRTASNKNEKEPKK